MGMTIDEAIQHIKNSCYIVGYPTHDKQDETRKRINASLDMAIAIMHKYQKIQEIVKQKDYDRFNSYNYYGDFLRVQDIRKVLEDENVD